MANTWKVMIISKMTVFVVAKSPQPPSSIHVMLWVMRIAPTTSIMTFITTLTRESIDI